MNLLDKWRSRLIDGLTSEEVVLYPQLPKIRELFWREKVGELPTTEGNYLRSTEGGLIYRVELNLMDFVHYVPINAPNIWEFGSLEIQVAVLSGKNPQNTTGKDAFHIMAILRLEGDEWRHFNEDVLTKKQLSAGLRKAFLFLTDPINYKL